MKKIRHCSLVRVQVPGDSCSGPGGVVSCVLEKTPGVCTPNPQDAEAEHIA